MTDNIFQIIAKVGEEAGALAPEKTGGVPFAFRGIDAVIAHLVPHLRKYGVITVPEVIEQRVTSREAPQNKTITQTEVLTKFTFYAPDGSNVSATTAGLAQDYSDRSTAQAQSVAFRVALLQTFTLPTHDKDPEVAAEEVQAQLAKDAAKGKPATATVDPLKATQDRVVALAKAAADKRGGDATGTGIVKEIAAANWPDKDFVKDVWKSVGALEIVEQKLKADAAA